MVGLALATGLLVASFGAVEWSQVTSQLLDVRAVWILPAIVANFLILVAWTAQWRVIVPTGLRPPYGKLFEIVTLTSMVSNTVPYMAGQALGFVLLARRGAIGHAAALSVVALEQLAEGLAKLLVLSAVLVIIPIPPWIRDGLLILVLAVGTLLIVLLSFAHRFRKYEPSQKTSPTLWIRCKQFVARFSSHLDALRSWKRFGTALLLAVLMKAAEGLAIYAVQVAFGVDLPFWSVLLVLASVGLATMVAVTPGNLGVYEATVFFVYQYIGLPADTALGLALLQHVCYLLPMTGVGYLVLWYRNLSPAQLRVSVSDVRATVKD